MLDTTLHNVILLRPPSLLLQQVPQKMVSLLPKRFFFFTFWKNPFQFYEVSVCRIDSGRGKKATFARDLMALAILYLLNGASHIHTISLLINVIPKKFGIKLFPLYLTCWKETKCSNVVSYSMHHRIFLGKNCRNSFIFLSNIHVCRSRNRQNKKLRLARQRPPPSNNSWVCYAKAALELCSIFHFQGSCNILCLSYK